FAGNCHGGFLTIEPTGEISACDRYIDDDGFQFGNVLTMSLSNVATSPKLLAVRAENATEVDKLRHCPWFAVCHGGCPHDRGVARQRVPGYADTRCGLAPLPAGIAGALRTQDVGPNPELQDA